MMSHQIELTARDEAAASSTTMRTGKANPEAVFEFITTALSRISLHTIEAFEDDIKSAPSLAPPADPTAG